jgi:hypothetical protein
MKISQECKEYESHALRRRRRPPFPIGVPELVVYIRYRARNSSFCKYMSNLECHPLHGYDWLKSMNENAIIQNEMKHLLQVWNINLSKYKYPLIGVDYRAIEKTALHPSLRMKKKYSTIRKNKKQTNLILQKAPPPPPPSYPNVHMVQGRNIKGKQQIYIKKRGTGLIYILRYYRFHAFFITKQCRLFKNGGIIKHVTVNK